MSNNKTYVEADWDNDDDATPPYALNWRGGPVGLQIAVTGTIDFDIESSNGDLQNSTAAAAWLPDSTNSEGITASKWLTFNAIPRFIRIKVNSFTTGATVSFGITQTDAI
jgi:hypothetical protein